MNELERTLRSLWNNFRDINDESGFNQFQNAAKADLNQRLRAARTNVPVQQVRRESFVEGVVSDAMAAMISMLSASRGQSMQRPQQDALRKTIHSIVRTTLYRENTSR